MAHVCSCRCQKLPHSASEAPTCATTNLLRRVLRWTPCTKQIERQAEDQLASRQRNRRRAQLLQCTHVVVVQLRYEFCVPELSKARAALCKHVHKLQNDSTVADSQTTVCGYSASSATTAGRQLLACVADATRTLKLQNQIVRLHASRHSVAPIVAADRKFVKLRRGHRKNNLLPRKTTASNCHKFWRENTGGCCGGHVRAGVRRTLKGFAQQ